MCRVLVSGSSRNCSGVVSRQLIVTMSTLAHLPGHHPLRLQPLDGVWFRRSILIPLEVTDTPEERQDKLVRRANGERKWMPWKQVKGWRIARASFNELGPVWTADSEWTFDNPKAVKQ